jgi:hypothetical protein
MLCSTLVSTSRLSPRREIFLLVQRSCLQQRRDRRSTVRPEVEMQNEPKLGLIENAYDFINESLLNASWADEDPKKWKFAVINAAQAIELLLKERLRREHSLLVYTQVDKPRHTVPIELALQRLETCGVNLDEEDVARVRRAKDIRNDLVHFSSSLTWQQLEASYIDLFEFAHAFHEKELGGELHEAIDEELWQIEASLMEKFRREFITYQGGEIIKSYASEIVIAQFFPYFGDSTERHYRIPYGHELERFHPSYMTPRNCHDCNVLIGQFHAYGCDCERCPRCGDQLLMCSCNWTEPVAWWGEADELNERPTSPAVED